MAATTSMHKLGSLVHVVSLQLPNVSVCFATAQLCLITPHASGMHLRNASLGVTTRHRMQAELESFDKLFAKRVNL